MEIIETQRLILRPWEKKDLPALVRYANNPKIWAGLRETFPHPYTEKEAQWWINHFDDNPLHQNRAIEFKGEAIGGIALHQLEDVYYRTGEVGYWLAEPFWGQGIATEALQALTRWALENTDLLRLQGGVFEGNLTSMRVMEKAGYHQEGIHRKAVSKDGKILDEICYVLLRENIE